MRTGNWSRGEHRPLSKLTEGEVLRIFHNVEGYTGREWAKLMSVSEVTIHYIRTKKRWRYLLCSI